MLLDLQRYDVTRWTASLGCLRVPVFALQTTYANEKRERKSVEEREDADQRHRGRRHEEVEDDQPGPAVPVEERSGDRADDEAGTRRRHAVGIAKK